MAALQQIKHIIVLFLENRSFDHMLGTFNGIYKTLEGVSPNHQNSDGSPPAYTQVPGAARVLANDPFHENSDVLEQLRDNNGRFVENYASHYPSSSREERAEILKYHAIDVNDPTKDALPALHTLARNFTICDHWFASVPGPTWTNRLFAMSGTSLGRVKMANGLFDLNLHWYDQKTIFDRLNERNIDWRVYYGDFPLSFLLVHQWEPKNAVRHLPMNQFHLDTNGDADKFPPFCFIEPSYLPPGANDDHPPHDILEGEALIASVYNAIRANDPLWESTLFVILFDEHGGLYDHVSPPAAIPPDLHQEEYTFDRFGVRVPALLISRFLKSGVLSETFDHTSLLRLAVEKWDLGPLGNRTSQAHTFIDKFSPTPVNTSAPKAISSVPASISPIRPSSQIRLSDHQLALFALSHALEAMSDVQPNVIATRAANVLSGIHSQVDAMVDRLEDFLTHSKAKLNA